MDKLWLETIISRFTDRITEDTVNVLIDHIVVRLSFENGKVWNPYEMDEDSEIQCIKMN